MPLHPLAVVLLPIPAMVAVLLAEGVEYGLLCLSICLIAACFRGARFAFGVATLTFGIVAMVWCGFALSLPDDPLGRVSPAVEWLPFAPSEDRVLVALRGALRIAGLSALFIVPLAFVNWQVLSDTLIDRFRVPYRLVDVAGLSARFSTLIRRDIAASRALARQRSRGRPLRSLRLLSGLAVPVLMASFRHVDELAIAMEARGFGALPLRTVHCARRVRAGDLLVLLLVWAVSVASAVALASALVEK